jgi:tRNA pseudouridine55 synthase
MDGILLVDKPPGITSFGVVERLKKKFNLAKVGHGGSLDPMATGLLVLLLGKATKAASKLLGGDKEYEARLLLGRVTDTQDVTGKVLAEVGGVEVKRDAVEKILPGFRGEIEQIPPMVSALKYKGRRLYRLAQKGREVPRSSRKVVIKVLEMRRFAPPYLDLFVRCSKGTYIRTLCHDLGERLGVGGCLADLRRKASTPFRLDEAFPLSRLLSGSREDLAAKLIPVSNLSSASQFFAARRQDTKDKRG